MKTHLTKKVMYIRVYVIDEKSRGKTKTIYIFNNCIKIPLHMLPENELTV